MNLGVEIRKRESTMTTTMYRIDNTHIQKWGGLFALLKLATQFPELISKSPIKLPFYKIMMLYITLPFSIFFNSFKWFFKRKERLIGSYRKINTTYQIIDLQRHLTVFFIGIPFWHMTRKAKISDLIRRKVII